MTEDQTHPIEPDAPIPPPAAPAYGGTTTYAESPPLPAQQAGYPAYQQQRPRFADQVLGMRAVVATALACLIVGGLGGFTLGRATGGAGGLRGGPGTFQQRGAFPNGGTNGFPNQQFGNPNGPFGQGQNGG
jgi:hypothetical protein